MKHFRYTTFYAIERAIKAYRRFAQERIQAVVPGLTVNQVLLLLLVADSPGVPQAEMASVLFKDVAAVTRMTEMLVKRGLLQRTPNPSDRRRQLLGVTVEGARIARVLSPVIQTNRKDALTGLTAGQIDQLELILDRITRNCQ